MGGDYILVNIPAAELNVVEGGKTALEMRVVVGQPSRETPLFSAKITQVQFNPVWNVPHHLAVEDVLNKVREDSRYIHKVGLRIFAVAGSDKDGEVDPSTINWFKLGNNRFPYRLRQDSGPRNAMGKIKFLLPNQNDIYLHDTPQRHLFLNARRAASSGCIRLEKPEDLAVYLLRNQPEWNRDKIDDILKNGKKKAIILNNTISVYLVYMTAWASENGDIHFFPDIYNKDEILRKAIFKSS